MGCPCKERYLLMKIANVKIAIKWHFLLKQVSFFSKIITPDSLVVFKEGSGSGLPPIFNSGRSVHLHMQSCTAFRRHLSPIPCLPLPFLSFDFCSFTKRPSQALPPCLGTDSLSYMRCTQHQFSRKDGAQGKQEASNGTSAKRASPKLRPRLVRSSGPSR